MNNFTKGLIVGGVVAGVMYKTGLAKKIKEKLGGKGKDVAVAIGTGAAIGMTTAALYTMGNINNTCRKINMSVRDIADATEIEVKENIVNEAVSYAAARKADLLCNEAARRVEKAVEADMNKTVTAYVNNVYSNVKGEVRKKLKDEVSKINIKDLREEVIEEAKSTIASRFEDDLEKISDQYAENLDKMSDLYTTMAGSIKDKFQNT